ncbi:MAG: fused MFS/spermidine synthase [Planctomycetota bacterium]
MLVLWVATITLSAFLLFLIQPMVARLLLPSLGGSPAVWNTCMVFFQAALLGGYAYAHLSVRILGLKRQPIVHAAVVLVALLFLPLVVPRDPGSLAPIAFVFSALGVSVAFPFFVLSSTSSLIQRYAAESGHRAGQDPYWLYAASNAGSLGALLAYPLVVEPALGLSEQTAGWSIAYVVFVVLMALVCFTSVRKPLQKPSKVSAGEAAPITNTRRFRWVFLAAIPSSLMLGVTQHITTDIAAVPLLWVIPLALYLVTFIIAFSGRQTIRPRMLDIAVVSIAVVIAAEMMLAISAKSLAAGVFHMIAVFVLTLACHSKLASDRPDGIRVTEFFLWVSVGGVLGGSFNALLAPIIFNDTWEYPIAILGALLIARAIERQPPDSPRRVQRYLVSAGAVAAVALLVNVSDIVFSTSEADGLGPVAMGAAIFAGILAPLVVMTLCAQRAVAFALSAFVIMVSGRLLSLNTGGEVLARERTFFGIHSVIQAESRPTHKLVHGITRHGEQYTDHRRDLPTLYFHKDAPLGRAMLALEDDPRRKNVAIAGLGCGSIAGYANAGETYTYYEIDPAVIDIAEDPELFTLLANARTRGATIATVLGDARLTIQDAPDGSFGLVVVDAFSSDAIPVHLGTVEAIELYFEKLSPTGLILMNISNRHVNMAPVFAANARAAGVEMRYATLLLTPEENDTEAVPGETPVRASTSWVMLARDASHMQRVLDTFEWREPESLPVVRAWTDDYANLISAIRWFE